MNRECIVHTANPFKDLFSCRKQNTVGQKQHANLFECRPWIHNFDAIRGIFKRYEPVSSFPSYAFGIFRTGRRGYSFV